LTTRVRLLLLAACVALFATACQVGVDVRIEVAENGSGLVKVGLSLDEEAADQVRNLEGTLVVSDAEEAGWTITGPEVEDDGLTWIRASKPFNSPEELTPIMEEIAGPDGAFRDFVLLREKSFAELEFTLTGLVDLTDGPTAFSDSTVAGVLGAEDDVVARIAELEEEFGPIEDNVSVAISVDLPGGTQGEAGEGGAVWTASFSDPAPTQVAASGSDENVSARLWRWVGIAALILFAIAAVIQLVAWLLERRTRKRQPAIPVPQQAGSAVPLAARGQMPAQVAPPVQPVPQPSPQPAARTLRLVVLDPAAVVYDLTDDPRQRLLPFVRGRGSEVPDPEIVESYREATLGRISTAEMWVACAIEGEPGELDTDYLSTVSMRRGASDFLAEMARREMDVAFLGNMPAEWERDLRRREGTETVRTWIVSGEVGVRNPDPGILEALRRETGVPFENCLLIDGRIINLDAAKTLGMSTAWFTSTRPAPDSQPGHAVVTTFSEFFRRR
jgi:FMN phosphatase YigB (HAD superfamily)